MKNFKDWADDHIHKPNHYYDLVVKGVRVPLHWLNVDELANDPTNDGLNDHWQVAQTGDLFTIYPA